MPSKKTIKIGLKDYKLFLLGPNSVTKIQGRTNTRQNCFRVDAALKENLEFFVFFNVCGPVAQATRRSQSKKLNFFTKAKIGLQINQSTPWSGLGRPGVTIHPGMSSRTSTSSPSTWTEEHHQEFYDSQEIDHDQDNEPCWATYSGSEAAEIAECFTTTSSVTSSDDNGPKTSPIKWYAHAPNEFQQAIDFMKPNNKGTKNVTCGTAPGKVAVARRRRQGETTGVHSQPRSWRSLTRRWRRSSRIIRALLAARVANPLYSYLF